MYGNKGMCPTTGECKVPSMPITPLSNDKMQSKSSKPDNSGKK